MKFHCGIAPDCFRATIEDRIDEYNESRKRTHLHLELMECTENRLRIREGSYDRPGESVFSAKLSPCDGGIEIEGDVESEGKPNLSHRIYHFIVKLFAWTTLLLLPYLAVVGITFLLGNGSWIVPLALPLFVFICLITSFLRDVLFVRRRFARFMIAYMASIRSKDTPPLIRKKKRKSDFFKRTRHLVIYHMFYYPVRLFLRIKLNFKPKKPISHKRKFIMIANHVTDYDMLFMSMAMRQQMYFVMSEHALRKGFASKLLEWTFAPIGRSKASNAGTTVMDILRHAKKEHNVGIFAEGFRTMSGENNDFSEGTGAMIKKMGSDLITYRIRGGFYSNPNWSEHIRRGRIWGDIVGIYSAEQLADMTVEQVNELIARDIRENADETQKQYRIRYKTRRGGAEHLEFTLLACPSCLRLGSFHSKDDRFFCDCGLCGRYNEYGDLEGESLPYHSIGEWFSWQKKFISDLPDAGAETVLLRAPKQNLVEIDDVHHSDRTVVETGELVQTGEGFSVGERHFSYLDIAYFDVVRHGYLLFTTTDRHYYEVIGKVKFPGLLSKMLWQRYGKRKQTESKVNDR